jgi:NADPH:quinone reductase-like Zn-dependent oxidoreductase
MRRALKILGRIVSVLLVVVVISLLVLALVVSHDSPCRAAALVSNGAQRMTAAVYRCYGPPAVVKLEEVAKPTPKDNQVLVRVQSASVNPYDWHFMRGTPYFVRLFIGVGAPKDERLGVDFAGTIEAVGQNVKRFKAGDQVFGGADGAFGQYVTVREAGSIAIKPVAVSFEQAAAVPIAGITALQGLRDAGRLRAGQKVLINGASGGVGTFAVQIAKAFGAEVTGVCSTGNLAMVRAIGADHVIDYTHEDFTRGAERYDLIFDTVGNRSFSDYRRVLKPEGRFVIIGAPAGNWIGPMMGALKVMVLGPFIHQRFLSLSAEMSQTDLTALAELMQAGKITSVIDRRYMLSEVPAAIGYQEAGHARGKVVIDVD